jgi:hypothetical protein
VTRGRFWALFGSWTVLWLLFAAAYAAVAAISYGSVLLRLLPEVWANMRTPTPEQEQEIAAIIFSPGTAWAVGAGYLGAGLVALGYALMSFGVNARAALAALEEGKIEPSELRASP